MCPDSLDSKAMWEIWYQDVFDRETPRQLEVHGHGLVEGLSELWARHLFETVQVDGQKGFSRFNLWWKQEHRSIEISGEWEGQIRLRKWVFGNKTQTESPYSQVSKNDLILKIAEIHKNLIVEGKTCEVILAIAKKSTDIDDFENFLRILT